MTYASIDTIRGARPSETDITCRKGALKGQTFRVRSLSGRNLDQWVEMTNANDTNSIYFFLCASFVTPEMEFTPENITLLEEMDAYSRGDLYRQINTFNGSVASGKEDASEKETSKRGSSKPAAAAA